MEKRIIELETLVQSLNEKVSKNLTVISELTSANSNLEKSLLGQTKFTNELNEKLKDYVLLPEKVSALEMVIEEFQSSNQLLQSKIDEVSNPDNSSSEKEAIPVQTNVEVKIGKKNFSFKFPKFNYQGKDLIASNVAKDIDLCKIILKENPELLKELK